jgi:hypothetical protein
MLIEDVINEEIEYLEECIRELEQSGFRINEELMARYEIAKAQLQDAK